MNTNVKSVVFPGVVFLAVLVLWEVGVRVGGVPEWVLPGPVSVAAELVQSKALIWHHAVPTIIEALAGLGFAIILGVSLALLVEWSETARLIIYPILIVSQSVPTIALAPLLVIWFGFGMVSKVIIIAIVAFFPIAINMAEGLRSTDRDAARLLKSLGATKRQMFSYLKLPASIPGFFSGLRIAGAYSMLGAVISEWFGAGSGLGILLLRASRSFLTDRVFATIVVIAVLSLLLVGIIEMIARVSVRWKYRENQ